MSKKHVEWGKMAHEGSVWEIPGLVDALRRQAKPEVYTAAELAKQLSERAQSWRPWRAYAAQHLWQSLLS